MLGFEPTTVSVYDIIIHFWEPLFWHDGKDFVSNILPLTFLFKMLWLVDTNRDFASQ